MTVIDDQLRPTPPQEPLPVRVRRWLLEATPEKTVGTLKYTGFGLVMVFVWLLWGDFIFTLLEDQLPQIIPLKLKELGAGDTLNAVLNSTFQYAMVFIFAPIVSFRSDRTRTRWGRRIPYLLWSAPFVALFFILIGCYDSLTHVVMGSASQVNFLGMALGRTTVTLAIFGAVLVGWDFANIFVNTVYWYLFNDVVPQAYLSRFLSLFRIVGTLAGMAFNAWVLPHGLTHFKIIFIAAGAAYLVGFLLMCFFVREGEYPPPPPNVDRRTGVISAAKTYLEECFTHRLYWYFFFSTACFYASNLSLRNFGMIRDKGTLGLSLDEIGHYRNWLAAVSLVLQYPAGWLADRIHPLRVYLFARIWYLVGISITCAWIFADFGHTGNLHFMYWTGLIFVPLNTIANAAELPMYMRLLPKDRYGQFCSANAMLRALAIIVLSPVVGIILDLFASHMGEWRYRLVPVWTVLWQAATVVFLVLLYREWKRHGGDEHYVPPGTEWTHEPTGFDPVMKH